MTLLLQIGVADTTIVNTLKIRCINCAVCVMRVASCPARGADVSKRQCEIG